MTVCVNSYRKLNGIWEMNEKVIIHKRQEDKPWDLSLTKLLAASAFYHLSRHDSMGNCIVPDVVSIQCAFLHQ